MSSDPAADLGDLVQEVYDAERALREAAERVPEADLVPAAARQALGAALQWLIDAHTRGFEAGLTSGPEHCVRDAAEVTGWSEPALGSLLAWMPAPNGTTRDVRELGNVALARMVRGYDYDHHHASPELHRRFPHLKGVHDAWRAAMPPIQVEDWLLQPPKTDEESRREYEDPSNDGYRRVRALYKELVDDIAAGRPYRRDPMD